MCWCAMQVIVGEMGSLYRPGRVLGMCRSCRKRDKFPKNLS